MIKHILSVIHYTTCGVYVFQFTHFICDDWENIHTLILYDVNGPISCINASYMDDIEGFNTYNLKDMSIF